MILCLNFSIWKVPLPTNPGVGLLCASSTSTVRLIVAHRGCRAYCVYNETYLSSIIWNHFSSNGASNFYANLDGLYFEKLVLYDIGNFFSIEIALNCTVQRLQWTSRVLGSNRALLHKICRRYSTKHFNDSMFRTLEMFSRQLHLRIYLLGAFKAPTVCSAAGVHSCRGDFC